MTATATVTVETRLVDVDARPVEIRVEYAPVRTVKVSTPGPRGPVGPVADLDLVLGKVDEAVQDYFVLHPQSYTVDHPAETYVWDVVHPLDHLPSVTVVDSAGSEVVGVESWPAPNRVVVEFNTPQAGTLILT